MNNNDRPVYSESFRQFLLGSECKVAQKLWLIDNYWDAKPAYRLFVTTNEVNYLTFRSDGTISYLPAGKEHKVSDSGGWRREGRQNGRPAKIIRKLFTKRALKYFKDSDFECFCNAYKAKFVDNGLKFTLRPHKDIKNVYDMRRVEEGRLGDSCMNGDSDYLDMYTHCKQLQILTLTNESNDLVGRALVWRISDEMTFMDRIYTAEDWMDDMFLNYAAEKGWWRKQYYQSYNYKRQLVNPEGENVCKTMTIHTETEWDRYPYIDTFGYGAYGWLSNNEDSGWDHEYDCTDGSRSRDHNDDDDEPEEEGVWDEINQETISEDDAVQIDLGTKRGQWTHRDNTVTDNRGYLWWEDDEGVVEIGDKYYDRDDTCYCEHDGEDYPEDECHYSQHEEDYIHEDDAVEINEEWYRKDDEDTVVEISGEYYLKDDEDTVVEVDGDWYLVEDDRLTKDEDGCYILKQLKLEFENE
jgi:hypothetical protein